MRSESKPRLPSFGSLLAAFIIAWLVFATFSHALRLIDQQLANSQVYKLIIKGETLLLDGSSLDALNQELRHFSTADQAFLAESMNAWADEQLDALFALSEEGVENYLDWYYSLPGSYLRLFYALKGNLPEQLEKQFHQVVFVNSGFELALEQLGKNYTQAFQTRLMAQQEEQLKTLQTSLHEKFINRQANVDESAAIFTLNLDQAFMPEITLPATDKVRWQQSAGLSVAVGAGMLALPAARAMTSRIMQTTAVRSATRITLAYVARLTPRLAAAMAASGTATAAAAPTGPGALVAGIATFTIFITTDWALLKAEELLYREDKALGLKESLGAWKLELAKELEEKTRPLFAARQDYLKERLNQPYVEAGVEQRFYLFPEKPLED
ncbi:hypothetical protein [Marinospirillum insulare]|uniref:Uncharacterized protein n=1 Tax=Marinospirillum insulare TaxID=217169 RepID=A0ABQ5ZT18_9GAMM|nr:hypothetical protein [Marinospirillum insulare]GLR62591.1 hypothetical protein GCM10007878_00260 [Marinospirillum insulare]